jgi:hypothetical protein
MLVGGLFVSQEGRPATDLPGRPSSADVVLLQVSMTISATARNRHGSSSFWSGAAWRMNIINNLLTLGTHVQLWPRGTQAESAVAAVLVGGFGPSLRCSKKALYEAKNSSLE